MFKTGTGRVSHTGNSRLFKMRYNRECTRMGTGRTRSQTACQDGGEPRIDVDADKDDREVENGGWPRELMWLLDLPGQTTLPKRHPHMVLCDPDIEKVVEMRYV